MKIIYIADDGTQFDDEFDCEDYEWKTNHPRLKEVHIFDKNGNEFENIFLKDAYNYSEKIIVPSDEAAREIRDLGAYTGYTCYEDISGAGIWVFDKHKETFIEVSK